MRDMEYHASNIIMEMILFPERKQFIAYKPLADMVESMIKDILEKMKEKNND